jgi:hypothetical protein
LLLFAEVIVVLRQLADFILRPTFCKSLLFHFFFLFVARR